MSSDSTSNSAEWSDAPSRPEKLSVELHERPDTVAVVVRTRGRGPGCFLLLWEIGWTVGCVVLMNEFINQPNIGNFAFGLPFWASWIVVAGLLAWLWFGREVVLVKSDEVLFQRKAIITLKSRSIPMSEVLNFRECLSSWQENDQHLYGIELTTLGKPLTLAYRLSDHERTWLIRYLNDFLDRNAFNRPSEAMRAATVQKLPSPVADDDDFAEPLTSERPSGAVDPPTDSSWQLEEGIDEVTFRQSGELSPATVLGLLFINCFWNGIVSVFVLALFGLMPGDKNQMGGWGRIGMGIFLIPFVVIGLVMFVALLGAIVEPFRRTTWTFSALEVTRETRWPFFRRRRRWDILSRCRLDVRRKPDPNASSNSRLRQHQALQMSSDTPGYSMVVVSDANTDVCSIENLSQGEARWIAATIEDAIPGTFSGY